MCKLLISKTLIGRRASTRKRTISKERRQSLLFEDQMATYCYVEVVEGFTPSSKSTAVLDGETAATGDQVVTSGQVSGDGHQVELGNTGNTGHTPVSPHWTLTNETPSFIIRVPNESIVRLFSFLVRSKLLSQVVPKTLWCNLREVRL